MSKKIEEILEKIIFGSRWLQVPMYIGLIVGLIIYAYKFILELLHLVQQISIITEDTLMLSVLTLLDITMLANLIIMIIIGGYSTFVSRISFIEKHEDKPEWLEKIGAGTLKVKLAASLAGVSGVHLLKTFINIQNNSMEHVKWQVIIHLVFLVSTLLLAYTDKVMHSKHT